MIALYYYENLTLREIGEVLGVTESRVSQLHTKAVLGLRSRFAVRPTRSTLRSHRLRRSMAHKPPTGSATSPWSAIAAAARRASPRRSCSRPGSINRLGRVDDGTTVCDFEPDEQERGMSIGAAVTSFEHDGRKINLIDTPGRAELRRRHARRRCASSTPRCSWSTAVMGVEVHTERLWRRADEEGLARLVFVNMLDRERADFFRCLELAQGGLRPARGRDRDPDRLRARGPRRDRPDRHEGVRVRGRGRGNAKQVEIPEELRAQAEEYREKLMDEVAENSDELMERYLEGEEISHEEIVTALKKGVTEGHLFPVTCGVATQNLGTNRLLEALVEDLPSPAMRGAIEALDADGEPSRDRARRGRRACSPTSSRPPPTPTPAGSTCCASTPASCARTRSVQTSPSATRSGSASSRRPRARRPTPIDELGPGDIGAVAKLRETRAGDVLAAKDTAIRFPPLDLPAPVMAFAYEPKSKGDEEKAATAIRRLTEEDPTLDVHRDPQTGEQIIAGLTQIHVEVIVDRMKRRFGAEIELHPPQVPYLETIRKPAKAHGRYKKQTGGRGQFGDCHIEIEPDEPGAGFEFVNAIKGGVIPGGFIPAVEKGIVEAMAGGVLAGYPMKDVQGAALRRPAPLGRLLGDGVQDRRLDGVQAGGRRGRRLPARADHADDDRGPRGRRSAT